METYENLEFSINVNPVFKTERLFSVVFNLGILDQNKERILYVEACSNFESVIDITEEFKANSMFHKVNAPAIFFPYLRAFVSNLTINSGNPPIILPTFNFTVWANK